MTREEDIKVLKNTEDNINYDTQREEIYFTHKWVGAYERAIAALREQPRWISVEERLPERGVFVLLFYAKNCRNPTQFAKNTMAVGRYDCGMFLVEGCKVSVTHWMPMPEPPEVEV